MNNTLLLNQAVTAGGVKTWTISGTAKDGEGTGITSVTLTLSGDSEGTEVTSPGGTWSFSGLVDGTYTVTPSKSGYTFSPEDAEVVISGADDATSDFVGTAVWTVSGDIVDGADAGIEGVSVALTGDDEDSTTTDVNGYYEFIGLVDGSYTVTPTKDGYTFVNASEAVNVSGDDVAVDDMVGTEGLTLPYEFSVTDLTFSNDAPWTLFPAYFYEFVGGGYQTPLLINAIATDVESFTPAGLTKCLYYPSGAGGCRVGFKYPNPIAAGKDGIRFAMLTTTNTAGAYSSSAGPLDFGSLAESVDGDRAYYVGSQDGGAPTFFLGTQYTTNVATAQNEMVTAAINETIDGGGAIAGNVWRWIRVEIDFVSNTVRMQTIRAKDGKGYGRVQAMAADGQSVNQTFEIRGCAPHKGSTADNEYIAKWWIGELTDAWPGTGPT